MSASRRRFLLSRTSEGYKKYFRIHNLHTSVDVCVIRIRVRSTLLHLLSSTHIHFFFRLSVFSMLPWLFFLQYVKVLGTYFVKRSHLNLSHLILESDKCFHWAGWCSCNDPDLYSGSAQFESLLGQWLSWLGATSRLSSAPEIKYQHSNLIRQRPLLSKSTLIYRSFCLSLIYRIEILTVS
jgi:hypothetical protein